MKRAPPRSVAILLACAQLATGCWSKAWIPTSKPTVVAPPPGEVGIVLAVSEAGVAWGDGSLGREIEDALRHSGFEVFYPVEPPLAPPLRLEVRTLGDEGSAWLWGLIGAAAIGYFFFVPALFWPFVDSYGATCTVVVRDAGTELRRFEVRSKARVIHALLADAQDWRDDARIGVYRDLAEQIASELSASLASPKDPGHG
jgi:hypothetical protein